ncbi:GvpL/GvpF family gas vesicle protein [Streptomyces sp. NPDC047108]|uniref:GvpL/GvpF family gas vesicle protein n=1 Tax=Streptomyces sp. NPDC047108 TaxID=3155025 RepID=UPI0033C44905
MTTADSMPEVPEQAERACYVYGIVSEPDDTDVLEKLPAVADPDAEVRLVAQGGIAAIVSEVPLDRPLGTPEDLHAHAHVLDSLAASDLVVLPFRFGSVLPDDSAVIDELLENGRDDFLRAVERLADQAQFTLRARYEEDAVLREVLEEREDIRKLREELVGVAAEAAHEGRIQLGELVSQAVAEKRRVDAAAVEEHLMPFSAAVKSTEPASADGVVDSAFLVEDSRRKEFEEAAEALARSWHGRVRFRLLGPVAAYDFVDDALSEPKGDR